MSNFAIVSCVFLPEPIVSAKTSANLAEELSTLGHQVMVITNFPNRPAGKIFPGYKRTFFREEKPVGSIQLVRCFSFFSSSSSMVSRWLENFSFGLSSSLFLLFSPRPDVIYANTWPIFGQGLIALTARLRRIPLVLSIQDVYPESLLAQNRFSEDTWTIKLLHRMDGLIARSASELIVISQKFAQIYLSTRGVQAERIHIVSNWINDDFGSDWNITNCRPGLEIPPSAFVFLYGGNIGAAAGLPAAIHAFDQSQNNRFLVIAGEGSHLQECQRAAAGSQQIKFVAPWQKADTYQVLAAADVFLLPTMGEQSMASVPSKLITYMLAGRPVLAAALPDSEIAEIILKTGCGWVVQPGDVTDMTRCMEAAVLTPQGTLKAMGSAGRQYALDHFTAAVCLPKVVKILEDAGPYAG